MVLPYGSKQKILWYAKKRGVVRRKREKGGGNSGGNRGKQFMKRLHLNNYCELQHVSTSRLVHKTEKWQPTHVESTGAES